MDYWKFDNTAYEPKAGKVLSPDAPFIAGIGIEKVV
jgi:hypothetical protein